MCCVNCRSCVDPAPAGWPKDPDPDIWVRTASHKDPDPVATQPLPDPAFRGPDPWKQPGSVAELERLVALARERPAETATEEAYSKPPKVPPRSYLKWLAVDLDGTLAEGIWTPEEPTSEIGDPIGQNVSKVRRLAEAGWKIVIHTARPWHDYESIEAWLTFYEIPFKGIVCGKLLAAAYIDDRAINADDPDWTPRSRDARADD